MAPTTTSEVPESLAPIVAHIDACIAKFEDPACKEEMFDIPFSMNGKERHLVHTYVSGKGFSSQSVAAGMGQKTMQLLRKDGVKKVVTAAARQTSTPKPPTMQDVETFATYARVPISCHLPELLDHQLKALDPVYNAKALWAAFCDERAVLDRPFKKEIMAAQDRVVNYISAHTGFQAFMKRARADTDDVGTLVDKSPYSFAHVNKTFLSVDLKQGNYAILKNGCPELFEVDGKAVAWEDFVAQFTTSAFIQKSKHFREVVFGKTEVAKVAQHLQEVFMERVFQAIAACTDVPPGALALRMKTRDEVIYEVVDPEVFADESSPKLRQALADAGLLPSLHYQVYELTSVAAKPYYLKTFRYNTSWFAADGSRKDDAAIPLSAKWELKCVPKKFLLQALRWVMRQPIEELDLHYMDDGMLCRYCNSIFAAEQRPVLMGFLHAEHLSGTADAQTDGKKKKKKDKQ